MTTQSARHKERRSRHRPARTLPELGVLPASVPKRETGREEGAGFVALQVAPRPTGKQTTTIELTGRHGERMRVEVQGELDLSSLVHAFRSMQS